ncbi:MAG TPA: TolC family protein [Terracidiphilus sp.]|jgi:outer membrane protein TolC|nr:TolC family protein [Terracidiphilus sp.]
MHSYRTGVYERKAGNLRSTRGSLRAVAAVMLGLITGLPTGFAQQPSGAPSREKAASALPAAPAPVLTEPFSLRQSGRDFSRPRGDIFTAPWKVWVPTTVPAASFTNSVRLQDLVKDGKIYLSLSDALALTIENNFDLAIARYNLDIADTDILRSKAGSGLRGVNSGVVTNTLGGGGSTLAAGGGPGGTTGGSGGAGSGSSGLVLSTNGAGPSPEVTDPAIVGTIQLERAKLPQTNTLFSGGKTSLSTNTDAYNFTYNQGFVTGMALQLGFNNSRVATDNPFNSFSPTLQSSFRATLSQHLLQGFGIYINKRFMYQALNDRRITDSSFRQQILFTVNQVENIYWVLVSAYEDVQAKEHALTQSTQLLGDTQKQLQIGTMAPLDVVNAQSTVATDKQALINSQNILQYQQLIMKQAIARNLNDPALESAPIIPTDRVSLDELPEEKQPVDDLVNVAFQQRPELEQAVLQLKNDAITLHGARNGLLPTLDVSGFYGGSGVGGAQSPYLNCNPTFGGKFVACPPGLVPTKGYGNVLSQMGDSTGPDKGVAFALNVPLRNRTAQADQARSLLEYRQAELRLEQLHTQIRMQVVNAQFALTNDRAQVLASRAAHDFASQSLDAEQKKLHLGASTTANVLQQQRNLAIAENNLLAAEAAYAKDRAGLYQTLAATLQHYNINLTDAAAGTVGAAPMIPGLVPASNTNVAPTTPPPAQ